MKTILINGRFLLRKGLLKIVMKTLIFFLCTAVFALSPSSIVSQNSKIKIEEDKVLTVDEVFDLIMEKTDYKFIYEEGIFNDLPKVLLKRGIVKTNALLAKSLSHSNLDITIISENAILLKKKSVKNTVTQQKIAISGTVSDENGQPLVGANILEKGTINGTQTDFDGKFSLEVTDENAILEISYIGFTTQEITVGKQTNLVITLKEDTSALDEVVVIGYGTKKKESVSGAIDVISKDVIESRPVPNAAEALQGVVPGLVVTRNTSRPGREGNALRIRDFTSINGGNAPLIIVDGIPGSITNINPDDIENISVLKDASASIYGSRAAGGVLLVTTKTGKETEKPRFNLSTSYSIREPKSFFDQPTTRQYAEMQLLAAQNLGVTPFWPQNQIDKIGTDAPVGSAANGADEWAQDVGRNNRYYFYGDTDWNDLVYENGSQLNVNFSVNGGTKKSKYYFSLGHVDTQGFFTRNKDFNKRYNLRLNYSYQLSDRINLNTNVSLERRKRQDPSGSNQAISYTVRQYPFVPAFTEAGEYHQWGGYGNPLQALDQGGTSVTENTNLRTNATATIDIVDGLKFVGQIGINFLAGNNSTNRRLIRGIHYDGRDLGLIRDFNRSRADQSNDRVTYQNYTGYFTYDKSFGDHSLSVQAGASEEQNRGEGFNAWRFDLISNDLLHLALGDAEQQFNNGYVNEWKIRSGYGRLSYNYKEKYFLVGNARLDSSSKFAEEHREGFFKGIEAAWRISEEDFMKNINFLNNLKLRASWGEVGNEAVANNYNYLQIINIGGNYPIGNGGFVANASYGPLASTNGTWETIVNKNLGVDLGLFQNRLNISFDLYNKKNEDMLVGITFPSILGAAAPRVNAAELEVNGWELNVGWRNKTSDFNYFVNFNLSDSKNKVTDLAGANVIGAGFNGAVEGYPINSYFGYDMIQIISDEATLTEYKTLEGVPQNLQLGDVMFRDVNGDGRISPDGDLVHLGTSNPRYNFGLRFGGEYKGLDFSMFFQGVGERTTVRSDNFGIPFRWLWWKPNAMFHNNTWTPDNPNAEYPRQLDHRNGIQAGWNYRPSRLRQVDGKYVRLKNVQIGYTLPGALTEKIGLTKTRIYFSANDVWEAHGVEGGYDPEEPNAQDVTYPFARVYGFGLQLEF